MQNLHISENWIIVEDFKLFFKVTIDIRIIREKIEQGQLENHK